MPTTKLKQDLAYKNLKVSPDYISKINHLHCIAINCKTYSSQYNYELKQFALSCQTKLHPSIKHLICKNCYFSLFDCKRRVEDNKIVCVCEKCQYRMTICTVQ
ncbi:RNAse P Rpr2/Rpp21/SNM1 subunit domain-containing protein [Spironucleus salmonicida]|uniref:RNAse P Rpr2/Rpp21/SNM1 subunit domain-containing protein n=1 Tax=Spironucleus salmonicida TaxID=348837 RepID=V6LXL8_9EUKA|nr:RNAse P Rpr2/Rpp21/SNM1 subunit domain-containing protein [Spironucleus salmonicida]|eukprot:EST49377.1 RNAse P Rpr2/Rpp21/SNM1 subunit domain-containing protein [Spironucleus salmonicida]